MLKNKRWIGGVLLMIAIGVGVWLIWQHLHPQGLPEGFASGNGRIEGTEVDVATKLAGRIAEILVNEGDFVTAGQVVARMDTAVFDAQLAQAKAQLRQAQNAQNTAALTCGRGIVWVNFVALAAIGGALFAFSLTRLRKSLSEIR
jgi:HlyD family secretion protein